MDSKYVRDFIRRELQSGRKYPDIMREMHGHTQRPSAFGADSTLPLQKLPSQVYQGNDHDQFLDRRRAPVFQGDPTQFLQRLADGGDIRDPMREINKRFDPMTPASRRGVTREAEMRSGNIPSTMERVGTAVMDYGPLPAQVATNIAMQPVRAGEAVGDAIYDPTLANVTNAGLQTGLAVARPAAALGALGLGYAEAARRDVGATALSDAQAQQRKRQQANTFNSYSDEQLADIERETGTPVSVLKTMRDVQIRAMVTKAATAKATGAAEAQTVAAKKKAEREAREAEAKRQEYTRAILRAESMRDAELARVRRFSGTEFGKIYDKTGGAAAALAAAAGGAMHNWASGGKTFADKIAWPALEGTGLAFTANSIPAAYNAFLTDSDNPEKAAYMAYARELPPDHPRKAEFMEYARSLPDQNPVRTTARKEYIEDLPKTVLISAIEGVPSALTGANAPRIGRKILGLDDARVPPGGSKNGGGGGANPPPPPEPPFDVRGLSPAGSKGQAAYPDPLREYVRKEYRTAVEKGGKPLDATVVNRSVQDAFQGTKYKAPNVRRRAQKTSDAIDDFVQKNGRMPQTDADWSKIWSRSTLALTPTIGLGAAMSEPEERRNGGAVARANRAMSKHWEKQNRYARGGTVHRKGMWKKGMRET